jgi:hypothetical protein
MILAADIVDFMNNKLIELLNNYVQRADILGAFMHFHPEDGSSWKSP